MREAQESRPDGSQASKESQARRQHEEEDDEDYEDVSNAKKVYLESNNSKKQLFLMCVGLMDGGRTGL
jgi:hypothetical protein